MDGSSKKGIGRTEVCSTDEADTSATQESQK